GIVPTGDGNGCLQDVHWYEGTWGYFAVYVPGAVAAAQLFQSAMQSDAGFLYKIRSGDFQELACWLNENVYSKASRWTIHEVLQQATGSSLSASALKTHLEQRYIENTV